MTDLDLPPPSAALSGRERVVRFCAVWASTALRLAIAASPFACPAPLSAQLQPAGLLLPSVGPGAPANASLVYPLGATVTGKQASGHEGDCSNYSNVYPRQGVRISPGQGAGRAWFDFGPVEANQPVIVRFTWTDNPWFQDDKALELWNWRTRTWDRLLIWRGNDGREYKSNVPVVIHAANIGAGGQIMVGLFASPNAIIQLADLGIFSGSVGDSNPPRPSSASPSEMSAARAMVVTSAPIMTVTFAHQTLVLPMPELAARGGGSAALTSKTISPGSIPIAGIPSQTRSLDYTVGPFNGPASPVTPVRGQPFLVTYQVRNDSDTAVDAPAAEVVFPPAVARPDGSVVAITPPAQIKAHGTATLTFSVTIQWPTLYDPAVPPVYKTDPAVQDVAGLVAKVLRIAESTQNNTQWDPGFVGDLDGVVRDLNSGIATLRLRQTILHTRAFIGQPYSLRLVAPTKAGRLSYGISDPFAPYEVGIAIWEPYKTDVFTAFLLRQFVAIPAAYDPTHQLAKLAVQVAGTPSVRAIADARPLSANMDWYVGALSGTLPFTDSATKYPVSEF